MPVSPVVNALMQQFLISNMALVDANKTKFAYGFEPIEKDCEGAEAVILFLTTDLVGGARAYTLRAAVRTPGKTVWTIPAGLDIGSLGTRKAATFKYEALKAPELYYVWNEGELEPVFSMDRKQNPDVEESFPKAPETPKDKGGRPKKIPKTSDWTAFDAATGIVYGGLTYNVDIDWPYFMQYKKVRMPREPVATIERLNEERPETEKLRRIRLKALHKEGHIENPSEYGAYLDPVTDEEFEASMIEVEERLRKEGMERETKAPRITPNHPAGANLIRMATIKVQDQTFKYIGEVMEYLDRMGLQDFTEAQMLEVLDAKGIRIER